MSLVMVWEVFVKELWADELKNRVAEELEALIRAQSEVVAASTAVRECSSQYSDVPELNANAIFKLRQVLKMTRYN
jgi:hypothetical protein